MQKCQEVMTRNPVTAVPTDTVEDVARSMRSLDIGPVPVVENQQTKKLIGIVTDRDLALKVVASGRQPKQIRVEEVMTRDPVTCQPEDDLQEALDAMGEYQVRRIPVVDKGGAIVGIIAQADVATRVEDPEKMAQLVEEISRAG
jgi:CBS domain-containing protein